MHRSWPAHAEDRGLAGRRRAPGIIVARAREQQPSYSDPTKTSLSNKAGILRSVSSIGPSVPFALISFLLLHHWVQGSHRLFLLLLASAMLFSTVDRFGSGKHKHAPDTVSYSRKGKLLPRMHEPSLLDRLAIMHVMYA